MFIVDSLTCRFFPEGFTFTIKVDQLTDFQSKQPD